MSNRWSPILMAINAISLILLHIPAIKKMWDSVNTSKEDLDVDWETLEKYQK
jgi:hypothetical protein